MSWTCIQNFSFWGEDFWIFIENLLFMLPWQPINFSDLDKIHMNRRGLLKKHFLKKNLNMCSETAKIASFPFSHYKSMETKLHSNYSSYPIGTKNTIIRSPTYICSIWNMKRNGYTALEKKSFENVEGRPMPAYTISSPMSLRLRWANKKYNFCRG